MVKFMKKYKKWLLLFSIIGAFIPVLPCEAKYEETHEVELIDMEMVFGFHPVSM